MVVEIYFHGTKTAQLNHRWPWWADWYEHCYLYVDLDLAVFGCLEVHLISETYSMRGLYVPYIVNYSSGAVGCRIARWGNRISASRGDILRMASQKRNPQRSQSILSFFCDIACMLLDERLMSAHCPEFTFVNRWNSNLCKPYESLAGPPLSCRTRRCPRAPGWDPLRLLQLLRLRKVVEDAGKINKASLMDKTNSLLSFVEYNRWCQLAVVKFTLLVPQ